MEPNTDFAGKDPIQEAIRKLREGQGK